MQSQTTDSIWAEAQLAATTPTPTLTRKANPWSHIKYPATLNESEKGDGARVAQTYLKYLGGTGDQANASRGLPKENVSFPHDACLTTRLTTLLGYENQIKGRRRRTTKRIISMEQNPSLQADICSADREIPCLLWYTKRHYRLQNGLSPAPISEPRETSPQPHVLFCLELVLILSSNPRLGLQSGLSVQIFNDYIFVRILLPKMHATCSAHLIPFHSILC